MRDILILIKNGRQGVTFSAADLRFRNVLLALATESRDFNPPAQAEELAFDDTLQYEMRAGVRAKNSRHRTGAT